MGLCWQAEAIVAVVYTDSCLFVNDLSGVVLYCLPVNNREELGIRLFTGK